MIGPETPLDPQSRRYEQPSCEGPVGARNGSGRSRRARSGNHSSRAKAEWSRISGQLPPGRSAMLDARDGPAGRIVLDGDGGDGTSVSCFGLWLRQRRRGDQRRNRGSLSVSRTRIPRPIGMRGTGGPAVDAWRPVLWAKAIIRWLPSWGDLIQARARSSPSGWLAGHASTGAPMRYCLPGRQAGNRTASLLSVHLPCCLCTNMWITCAQQHRACA